MLRIAEGSDDSAAALAVNSTCIITQAMSSFEPGIYDEVSTAFDGIEARHSGDSTKIQLASARDRMSDTGAHLLNLLADAAAVQDLTLLLDALSEMVIEAGPHYRTAASYVGPLGEDERVVEALIELSLALS